MQQPSCQCFSWVRNHFPCKHFFAIFRHHPQWGWDKLPDDYANSPLRTLDEAIIGHGKPINSSSSSHELVDNNAKSSMPNHDNFHGEITASTKHSYANLPNKKGCSEALGSICRETLNEIRQLTFLIDDLKELESLKTELQGIYQKLKMIAPSNGGLQVESGEPEVKKRKLRQSDHPGKKLPKIPKTCPRKHKFKGRHGIKAAVVQGSPPVMIDNCL